MLIDGKKYTYRQLMEETGLSRSTLHRRIKALKESGVPLTMGAIVRFPTAWSFYDEDGTHYLSKTDYSVKNSIPYYQMFQNSNSKTKE
ncbi:winged helix-turn-helix domain-containing protein [Pleurocapsales cyanobacterium LEGE 06147]|nr:winged helix-turn-helix domain-containing protein [Pleurocapsales cyanobacterium LEGE 06147]